MEWKNGRCEVEGMETLNSSDILKMVNEQVERTSKTRAFQQFVKNQSKAKSLNSFLANAVSHHWDGLVNLQAETLDKKTVKAIEMKIESANPLHFLKQVLQDGIAHFVYVEDETGAGFRTYSSVDIINIVSKKTGELAYLLIESTEPSDFHVIFVQNDSFTVYKGDCSYLEPVDSLVNASGTIEKITKLFNYGLGLFGGMRSEKAIWKRTPLQLPHDCNTGETLKNWKMLENLQGYQQIQNELIDMIEETLITMAEWIQEQTYPASKKGDFSVMLFKRHSIEDLILWNSETDEEDVLIYFGEGYERHFLIPPANRSNVPDTVMKDMNRKHPNSLYRTRRYRGRD